MIGILYALVPMIAWGSVGFVANKLGGDARQQTLGMTLGAFIFALIIFVLRRPALPLSVIILGFISGLIWTVGQSGQFHSFKYLGVSVAGPLSGGTQIVLASIIGVFAFHEWIKSIQFILGVLAIIALMIGFYFSAKRDPENSVLPAEFNLMRGLGAVTYSTLGYVGYVILINNLSELWFHITFDKLTIIFPMSIGMIAGALILSGGKVKLDKYVARNMLVGIMWSVGNVFLLFAANISGIVIALTFSQMGAIISTIGGIIFLGEKKTKRELRYVLTGGILFVVGAVLLAIVKSQS